ncbi:hypothetical protein MAPG_06118 [Magnaporthiopsis poae ATCC 64411]|uniref:Ankyrin repeat protein n=1 Tax=Magnaporthiopsis poae (strain ATCC 64411 / 73-15) TaxID=644358 RepID=A0A0C4E169_MAGP6|nr:hypothetical protein MAPG_06118 [Magnaporthiopsis poae ATCC 64411]
MNALGLAVDRRYFDLADLLLSHGAAGEEEGLNGFYASCDVNDKAPGGSEQEETTEDTILGGGTRPDRVSLLGLKLQSHGLASLESISYLARVHALAAEQQQDQSRGVRINPLCNESAGLSAVHMLALFPAERWNSHAQTSERIVQKVLDMFPDRASLGPHAVHSRHGTPLSAAVINANAPVVAALLQSAFAADLDAPVRVEIDDGLVQEETSPRALAVLLAEDAMRRFEQAAAAAAATAVVDNGRQQEPAEKPTPSFPYSADEFARLRRRLDVASMLAPLTDSTTNATTIGTPPPPSADFYAAKMLEYEQAMAHAAPPPHSCPPSATPLPDTTPAPTTTPMQQLESHANRLNLAAAVDARDPDMPVDLSVVTEEVPSGWYEGVEMDAKMALRIFLKSFRSGDSGFGDPVTGFMDKTFNTRRGR